MSDCVVVVVRLKSGHDMLGILVGELDDVLRIEHPYYVKVSPTELTAIAMMPYCPLSDEIMYEIERRNVEFVVPASETVSYKFLSLVNEIESDNQQSIESLLDQEEELDRLEAKVREKIFVEGTKTKH